MDRMSVTKNQLPIGVFDSGVGGLSVLAELRRQFPHEDFVYVGDNAHNPVGNRPHKEIEDIAVAIGMYLETIPVKMAVIACNTFTVVAYDALAKAVSYPLIGVTQGVQDALQATCNHRVGIMATVATIESHKHKKAIGAITDKVTVIEQPCPDLAALVEQGHVDDEVVRKSVQEYVTPVLAQGVDTIVLGCTHYPLITALFDEVSKGTVSYIDPAKETAALVRQALDEGDLHNSKVESGQIDMRFTGGTDVATKLSQYIFSEEVIEVQHVSF